MAFTFNYKYIAELVFKLNKFNQDKSNYNLSEDENNFSYSHLLDKSHLVSNEKINSPIFVKLLLIQLLTSRFFHLLYLQIKI